MSIPLRALLLLALNACATAPTDDGDDTDTDTDVAAEGCCVLQDSLLEELELAGTDPSTFETACAQFDDTTTYPGTVGQELCGQVSDGRWCQWTCD